MTLISVNATPLKRSGISAHPFRLRSRTMRRAFCLSVRAFTNPPIGEALAGRTLQGFVGAHGVIDAERRVRLDVLFDKSDL